MKKQANMQPKSMKPKAAGDLNVSCRSTHWERMERQGSSRRNVERSMYLQTHKQRNGVNVESADHNNGVCILIEINVFLFSLSFPKAASK